MDTSVQQLGGPSHPLKCYDSASSPRPPGLAEPGGHPAQPLAILRGAGGLPAVTRQHRPSLHSNQARWLPGHCLPLHPRPPL